MQRADSHLTGTPPNVTYEPIMAFWGTDSFTFKIKGDCYDSDAATITINVGVPYPIARCQNVTVKKNTPDSSALSGYDFCGDNLIHKVKGSNKGVGQ